MYCKARLLVAHAGLTLVWSPLEKTDRYAVLLHAPTCSDIPRLVDLIQGGARAVVYAPPLAPAELIAKHFDFFCRVVAAEELRGVRVLIEELSRVTSASWAPPAWRNLSTAGAHAHLELIATAQQPSMIDKAFIGNATQIRCYRLVWEMDARRMAQVLRLPYAELMDLSRFHFRHRVVEDRVTVPGVQAIIAT
jgi:hypothetical protein